VVQGKPYDRCFLGVFDAKEATDSRLVLSDTVQLDFRALLEHSLRRDLQGDAENTATVKLDDVVTFGFSSAEVASCVFAELFILKKREAEAALSSFQPLAARYRDMPAKPPVAEEQRKFIVQANSMTQQKEYGKAMALYRKALDVDPLSFPAAYYNMALIASQQGNIFGAILHMKKYLLLVPDAEDARSAQDKIYEWQAKVGE
jgi:tetratricopeptide (TPR) repeat protein